MKTIAQLRSAYDLSDATDFAISEVQRDAREGMVPESDYDDLLRVASHMHVNNQKDDSCAKCGEDLRHPIHHRFRAKYPNLFTK